MRFPAARPPPEGGASPPRGGLWRAGGGGLRWGWRLALFTLLFFGLLLTLNEAEVWLHAPWETGRWSPIWGIGTILGASLLTTWVMMEGLERMPMAAAGLPVDGGTLPSFLRGALLGGALVGGAVLVAVAAGWIRWTAAPGGGGWPTATALSGLFFGVAALAEEILFRGYPFQVLAERWGGPAAVAVSAAVFAAAHAPNPGVVDGGPTGELAATALVNISLAGVLLGLAYWRTYSLWFAAGLHFGWNWVMGFAADLPVSGLELMDAPGYDAVVRGPELWTGGSFGLEGGLLGTLAAGVGIVWVLLGPGPRRSLRIMALRPLPERYGRDGAA